MDESFYHMKTEKTKHALHENITQQASVDVQLFLFYKFEFLLYAWCWYEAIATQLQLPEEDQSPASRKYPPKTMHQYNIPFYYW